MVLRGLVNALALASGIVSLVAASAPLDLSVRSYNAPGETVADTHSRILRGLEEARLQKREELKGNTTLDRSWNGAVLLKFGLSQDIPTSDNASSASVSESVEIVCTTCYVKGTAFAELQIPDNFDASKAVSGVMNETEEEVGNFTEAIHDYFEGYFKNLTTKFGDGIDIDDFAFPPLNYSFDMNVPAITECTLDFRFDGLELYLQLDTILGAALTYELNLYTSNSPIGIGVGKDLTLGVVFKVDLLLSVEGSIDISSGLHIKLDDGLAINIALFGDKVSNIVFNGGQFEFLPVTVESAGVVLSAVLRIGIHSGISVSTPDDKGSFTIFNTTVGLPKMSGGIEVGVYANLAEFTTNVTVAPKDEKCELQVVQEYQMALGAIAGASVVLNTETWGPVATTSIPIWNTHLASICAVKGTKTAAAASATPTITAGARKREDLSTTTTTMEVTHTGVQCISSVAGNCPVSLQSTTQSTEKTVLTTAVPSGQGVVWPATVGVSDKVTSTVAFGSNVNTFTATSGSPTSYTPPPTPSAKDGGGNGAEKTLDGKTGGMSNKVIVGVSVGIGVPVIAGIIAALVIMRRRKRYNNVPGSTKFSPTPLISEPYGHDGRFEPYRPADKPKKPDITVSEVHH